ncbi:MAG: hypothetical protein IIA02_06895 [Proteobacteria bacterium]|uniref:glutaredoxin family protein n=1 Tax=Aquabacterium sp. TaxID=1872578 RepID=UPI0035C69778|nr:hypothetical protein [Pseudomonadota bacterium]
MGSVRWGWVALLLLAVLVWQWRSAPSRPSAPADIAALAATVGAEEVLMYTTTTCTYCAQARHWLDQQGFAYTECNMSTTPRCEQEFLRHGGTGTPYLVVRGHHMKDGFDSDEFLDALRAGRGS